MKKISNILLSFITAFPSALGGDKIRAVLLNFFFKEYGKNIGFQERVNLIDSHNISIGSNSNFGTLSCLCANGNGSIEIGEGMACNRNVFINAGSGFIKIENNVMIGPNSVLRASNHDHSSIELPMKSQGHIPGSILIKNDVWIGANVVITSNVTIGEGTIVAAGSVVTKDLDEFSIYGGVPAKLIRQRK